MHLPNFFLIGASRSGTTSAYHYLKSHPEIYMSPVKEPRYYAYRDEKVDPDQYKAIGEASPVYLYSPDAPKEIYNDVPDAKLIAILRDPVQRAYSDYLNMLRLGRDFCESFEKAVLKEEQRIENKWGPFYHYVSKGFYHKQLNRYQKYFDEDQFLILTLKKLVENTQQTMEEIFDFLGVNPDFKLERLKKYNKSGVPKNINLHKIITHPLVPLPNFVKNLNITFTKPEIDPDLREELFKVYQDDIEKLKESFGLNVLHWG